MQIPIQYFLPYCAYVILESVTYLTNLRCIHKVLTYIKFYRIFCYEKGTTFFSDLKKNRKENVFNFIFKDLTASVPDFLTFSKFTAWNFPRIFLVGKECYCDMCVIMKIELHLWGKSACQIFHNRKFQNSIEIDTRLKRLWLN